MWVQLAKLQRGWVGNVSTRSSYQGLEIMTLRAPRNWSLFQQFLKRKMLKFQGSVLRTSFSHRMGIWVHEEVCPVGVEITLSCSAKQQKIKNGRMSVGIWALKSNNHRRSRRIRRSRRRKEGIWVFQYVKIQQTGSSPHFEEVQSLGSIELPKLV